MQLVSPCRDPSSATRHASEEGSYTAGLRGSKFTLQKRFTVERHENYNIIRDACISTLSQRLSENRASAIKTSILRIVPALGHQHLKTFITEKRGPSQRCAANQNPEASKQRDM